MKNKWKIIYYISPSGDNPVSDFLDSLEINSQSKILRILHNVEEYGLDSIIPISKSYPELHFGKLEFWEKKILESYM